MGGLKLGELRLGVEDEVVILTLDFLVDEQQMDVFLVQSVKLVFPGATGERLVVTSYSA